jgi:curved DNA-binding protein
VSKAAGADVRMAELNAAYDVLGDPIKRAAYDEPLEPAPQRKSRHANGHANGPANGHARKSAPDSGWSEGFDFTSTHNNSTADKDLFEQLFSEAVLRRHTPQPPEPGRDQHATIELSLKEAYEGVHKTISLATNGARAKVHSATAHDLEVTIPKGVFEGQSIRLAGRGEAGTDPADAGDLLLKVKFKPDVHWRTVGRDVYGGPVMLAPWEAALGAWTTVRTPTGEAEVNIPPHWKSGRTLRLKGRGIPAGAATTHAGDLYLELAVALPSADGPEACEAYAAMARAFPTFAPRAPSS